MSETKINLDAFLKRNSAPENMNHEQDDKVLVDSVEDITDINKPQLGISEQEPVKNTQAPDQASPLNIESDTEAPTPKTQSNEAINEEIKAWLEAVHEEIKEVNPPQAELKSEPEASSKRHNLSLDSLLNWSKKPAGETEVKPEVQEVQQIEKQIPEDSPTNKPNETKAQEWEEKELFWNYESKFSSQSTKILERLRVPKTRVGMLASLAFFSVAIIGMLMYINPETHSISNYKASINTIYNDIKKWDNSQEPTRPWPTGITWEIEDISRKDNPPAQDITSQENLDNDDIPEPRKKEDIKKENLKNFLIENYK